MDFCSWSEPLTCNDSKWPPCKERKVCNSCLSCFYRYSILWILKLSIVKCFWFITCVLVETYRLSMYVLKSLNVCELVAGLFNSIHHYNIISDSSHSTVGYFTGPSFWFRAPNKVKNTTVRFSVSSSLHLLIYNAMQMFIVL